MLVPLKRGTEFFITKKSGHGRPGPLFVLVFWPCHSWDIRIRVYIRPEYSYSYSANGSRIYFIYGATVKNLFIKKKNSVEIVEKSVEKSVELVENSIDLPGEWSSSFFFFSPSFQYLFDDSPGTIVEFFFFSFRRAEYKTNMPNMGNSDIRVYIRRIYVFGPNIPTSHGFHPHCFHPRAHTNM